MSHKNGRVSIDNKLYDIITLDFETFYGDEYTLSGTMNTSEYVRDERFKAHGVGIKIRNNKTKWYETDEDIRKALSQIDWANSALLAHNTGFDGFICSQIYGVVPALYLDTLSMARAAHGHNMRHDLNTLAKTHGLGGKTKKQALINSKNKRDLTVDESKQLGEYCIDDVADTYELFWKLYKFIPDEELTLIHITLAMFCDPILEIDETRVLEELKREIGSKKAALDNAGVSVEALMSNVKFAEALSYLGITPPRKVSPATGKMTFAFAKSDAGFQALLEHSDIRVRNLCRARLAAKSTIGETRAIRFLEAGKNNAKLPVMLQYSGAHTHRWSGGNKMNLQNLKRGGELRRSILAPKDHVIVVADSAQIEARILAWIAEQNDIVLAFANKQDVYKAMASAIYNTPVSEVTKDQRFIGKVCVLGLGYGMGAAKLKETLRQGAMGPSVEITIEEAQHIVNIYRSKNWKIRLFWKRMEDLIAHMIIGKEGAVGPIVYGRKFIRLPNGLFLQYPGLKANAEVRADDMVVTDASYETRNGTSKLYGGLLTENLVQALARCVIAEQMLEVHKAGYRIATMTHDEIVVVAHKDEADKCFEDMLRIMSTPPVWAAGLPLAAEGGYDVSYSK